MAISRKDLKFIHFNEKEKNSEMLNDIGAPRPKAFEISGRESAKNMWEILIVLRIGQIKACDHF